VEVGVVLAAEAVPSGANVTTLRLLVPGLDDVIAVMLATSVVELQHCPFCAHVGYEQMQWCRAWRLQYQKNQPINTETTRATR
jgi:hypothetical protein